MKWLGRLWFMAMIGFSQTLLGQTPMQWSLEGTLIDSAVAEPVVYASLQLMNRDSLVAGTLSDEKGAFAFKNLAPGSYRLEITHLTYARKIISPLNLGPEKPHRDMGKIGMAIAATDQPAVEITDRQDMMLNNIDKKVYNVERNQLAAGGAVTDILKNIPSVEVDIDGNLSLRGSANVTVLIDGKPSSLTGAGRTAVIQQIPASSVKSIEVITNPSARYDPDGMAGIINIITKKEKAAGLNGNLSVGLGNHNKYNSSLGLNFRTKHFNVYTSYSFRSEDRWNRGWSKTTTPQDTTSPYLGQWSQGNRSSMDNMLRGGIDFFLGKPASDGSSTTLGIAGGASLQDITAFEGNGFDERNGLDQLTAVYMRPNTSDEQRRTYDGEVNFARRFKQPSRTLDARVAYSTNATDKNSYFRTVHLLENGLPTTSPDDFQNNYLSDRLQLGTAQVDYVQPIGDKNKVEAGGKVTSRDITNGFVSETLDHSIEQFVGDTLLNNTFDYRERIVAGYGIFSRALSTRFGMQVGLRAEQAYTRSRLVDSQLDYTNNYFNLFPNAYLNFRPRDKQDLRLSYSRRINRPTLEQLNPFTDYSNPKRLRVGNPKLLPEYVDAFELSWSAKAKKGSISSTGYFRYTTNSITRFWEAVPPGSDTLRVSFMNLLAGQNYGLEVIGEWKPAKWVECMATLNVFRTVLNADNISPDLTVDNLGLIGQMNSTFFLGKKTSLQIGANYRSPRFGPQGVFAATFVSDVSLKQNLLKGKGSLNLRLSDITNTQRFKISADTDLVVSDNYRKRESRVGYVTFSYRFGKGEAGPSKRRRQDERQGGESEGGF